MILKTLQKKFIKAGLKVEAEDSTVDDVVDIIMNVEPLYLEAKDLVDGRASGADFDEFLSAHEAEFKKHRVDSTGINGADLLTELSDGYF